MLAIDAVKVENTADTALKIAAAREPVTVRLETVVELIVEDPDTLKLPAVAVPAIVVEPVLTEVKAAFPAVTFPRVVEARVEEPETARF